MESSGTWKERNHRCLYYEILHQVNTVANVQANWHGVPAAKEDTAVTLSPAFLAQYVIPPYAARLIITFEDKLSGDPARDWVSRYAAFLKLELQLHQSFHSGYHILHISGPGADATRTTLFASSPLSHKEWYAAVYPLEDSQDLE
jgi:hypothetical protein